MTAAATSSNVRYLVCADCASELVSLGARRVQGPHVIPLQASCEAHGELGVLQAAHVVELSSELEREWWAARRNRPIAPFDLNDRPEDALEVARLAAVLMAHAELRSADEIAMAVVAARRILRAARGL